MTVFLVVVAIAAAFIFGVAAGRWNRRGGAVPPSSQTGINSVSSMNAPRAPDPERQRLQDELDKARADVTRYRALIVDIENNAPSLLMGPGAPDDLKLIVGVGPVLERMLHQLGVTTFRQIAN